ncbi:MAG: glycosyltransferase family 2 protein [Candidatus Aenigmarchaeota archaeon]|nr:glycosyltransferase family 2 protein [Candidatus Aenigmarchaeota archaeon]
MLSVVIPAYNEEENIKLLYGKLKQVLDKLKQKYEIIFVDDGSEDKTFSVLSKLAKLDRKLRIIRFKRNFGQSAAISAGFQHAKGNIIITLDADLQNDPSDIPKLLENLSKGYDIVCGWRKKRKDPFFTKKLPSTFSNWVASKLTGLKIHDFGCTLRAYKKEVVKDMDVYGEMHRYIPALARLDGYSVTEVEVKHHSRKRGKTKYNIFRIFKGLSDLVTLVFIEKFGTRPGHIFISAGVLSGFVGFLILSGLIIHQKIYNVPTIVRPLLYISIIMMFGGVQFVTFGILSEMITKLRYEIKGKFYKIKEII